MLQNSSYPFKSVIREIKKTSHYFGALTLLLVIASVFLLIAGKAGSFISLNSYHSPALNIFFINYTYLGDGIVAVCLIAFFFYRKKSITASGLLISFLFSAFIVQAIKNLVHAPRPKLFFEEGQYLFFIDGVTHGGHSGFPSGHTATAFAMVTAILLLTRKNNLQLLLLAAAALVGYSRIYLAQHFLIDVIIGSVIGCFSGVAAVYVTVNAKKILSIFSIPGDKKAAPEPVAIPTT